MADPATGGDRVRVLYVIGYGRSGSTVLDTVLGTAPTLFGVGELTNLVRAGWVNREFCACGERGDECSFWAAVREAWEDGAAGLGVDSFLALRDRYERYRPSTLLRLARELRFPSAAFERYQRYTAGLFRAIRDASGAATVVDSSKNPLRGLVLLANPALDVRFVHLTRDPRGVAWSLMKPLARDERAGVQHELAARGVTGTAWRWALANLNAEWVARRAGPDRTVRIRYEDFTGSVEGTVATIRRIAGLLGADLSALERGVRDGRAFRTGHTIAGNRLRMGGEVRLRADTGWRRSMSPDLQRGVARIAGPMMTRYGYAREPQSDPAPARPAVRP